MLSTIKQRLERDDEQGFTLIELMVVVLIIAILLAIAIPTFLGAKSSANARAAQSDDRNAITAEQTVYTNGNQTFSNDVAANGVLFTAEPNINWTTTAPASGVAANTVAVYTGTSTVAGDTVWVESLGKDGNCWIMQQVNDPNFGHPATSYAEEGGGACTAPGATPAAVTTVSTGSAQKGGAVFPTTFYTQF